MSSAVFRTNRLFEGDVVTLAVRPGAMVNGIGQKVMGGGLS